MKTVILAGGFGTRLAEFTHTIPKPMVTIGNKPVIWHIMNSYASRGFNDFVVALGYKAEVVKEYFLNYSAINSDFSVDMSNGDVVFHNSTVLDWKVTLVDTGLNTMTGGRLKRLATHLSGQPFMATYGDGLANVDIPQLVRFHRSHGKMATVTTVRPSARFGELDLLDNKVMSFAEKPQTSQGWINGGYFVFEPEFLDLIDDDETVLERMPLEVAASRGELMAFRHEGFWQCMDTVRDREYLQGLVNDGKTPWMD